MPRDTDQLVVQIEFGNDAMQTMEDAARALTDLARRLPDTTKARGVIRDDNGNRVGGWELRPQEED